MLLAVVISLLLSKLAFGTISPWRDAGITAAFALLGGFTREPLGDAIIFTIIVGAMTAVACTLEPLPLFLKQIGLAVAVGACSGKLVVSAYSEHPQP